MSLVYGNDPVIWEVLVHDFSHLGVFGVQDLWSEGKEHEDNRSLLSKCDRSVLGIRIGSELVVDVIILDRVDQILNQYSVDRIPVEILTRVVLWDYLYLSLWIVNVPSATD